MNGTVPLTVVRDRIRFSFSDFVIFLEFEILSIIDPFIELDLLCLCDLIGFGKNEWFELVDDEDWLFGYVLMQSDNILSPTLNSESLITFLLLRRIIVFDGIYSKLLWVEHCSFWCRISACESLLFEDGFSNGSLSILDDINSRISKLRSTSFCADSRRSNSSLNRFCLW